MANREEKLRRINDLQAELATLKRDVEVETDTTGDWPPKTFYWWYHITTGSILGGIGAIVSLLFNVIGSVLFDKHPFELIKVFMTFPMGGSAIASDSDVTLLIGIMLYVVTGAFYGVAFEVFMYRFFSKSPGRKRVIVAILLGLLIWVINFYGILSWLQPLLFGGNWILSEIPFWVAGLTHIVFALSMVAIGEWGHFEATDYRRHAMVEANS
jgi:hypothetical protein